MSQNQVAIVTGGGSGIGLAIAGRFVASNVATVIVGRNEEKLKQACQQLGDLGSYKVCDVNVLPDIPRVVEEVANEKGRIDILVNNAGINIKRPFVEVSDEEFQQVIQTNLSSVFAFSREVVKVMLKQQSGNIINISSMAAQYGIPKVIGYTASKTAVEGMTRAMATELSPEGIRVNCIAPGFIATDMSAKALDNDPERKGKVMGRTPMKRLGATQEIGEAAWFLASSAASYITGTVLPVDGGNSIGF